VNNRVSKSIFFYCPTFCEKTQKCLTFSENCRTVLLFQILLVPLYLELRCTLKSDENFVLIIPLYLELQGTLFLFFFRNFCAPLHLDLRGILWLSSVKPSTIKKDYQRENTRWTYKINGVIVDDSERYTNHAHMSLLHVLAFVTTTRLLSIKSS